VVLKNTATPPSKYEPSETEPSEMEALTTNARGSTVQVANPREDANIPTAEQVAHVIAGIPVIGEACDALRKAGWSATIAGNRITVNDGMSARFIGATVNHYGAVNATWVIHAIAGTPPVWIVGAGGELR
jgi:hypothetical protein